MENAEENSSVHECDARMFNRIYNDRLIKKTAALCTSTAVKIISSLQY